MPTVDHVTRNQYWSMNWNDAETITGSSGGLRKIDFLYLRTNDACLKSSPDGPLNA